MKKLIFSLFLIGFMVCTISESKAGNDRFEKHKKQKRHPAIIFEQLDLTDIQKAEVKTILDEHHDKIETERKARRNADFEELKLKLEKVLSKEQITELDELKNKKMSGESNHHRKNGRLDYLTEELDLSVKQRAELDSLFQSKWENRKESRSERKKDKNKKVAKENREEFRSEIAKILTPEQLDKFDELGLKKDGRRSKRGFHHCQCCK